MADYKKYAKNLIGNWETGQYEPQKQVTQDIYQTNWNKLSNDFSTLKDKLARNFENAQLEYSNVLDNVQNASFNRMRNANIDLANRGLTTSGIGDLMTQADIQAKGEDVDKALADLLAVNNASIEGLTQGVTNLGKKQSELAGDLAGDLGKLTEAEANAGQQYAGLLANIGEGAAQRALSRRNRGGGSGSGKSKEDKDLDNMYRTLGIIQTLNDGSLSDDEKRIILTNQYDVNVNKSINAINSYNNNKLIEDTNSKMNKIKSSLPVWGAAANSPYSQLGLKSLTNLVNNYKINRLNSLNDKISGLTYTDLNNLLFNKK